ncbi:MAG: ATP-binding protein [Acidobacteriota bacterium]|nr:ATP-binding protein [Acidobacteriota bacterium]
MSSQREQELLDLQTALARTASNWQRTMDALGFPILVLDERRHLLDANAAAFQLLDQRPEELLGRRLETLGEDRTWNALVDLVDNLPRREGGSISGQVRSDDKARTWELTARFVSPSETDEAGILVTARDVSRLVKLQEAMSRRETVETLGSLVAGVAHEVRNPVFAISARCDSILHSLKEEGAVDPQTLREDIEALMRSADRLGRLMRALLEFGRPLTSSLSRLAPHQLLSEAVEDCTELAEARSVALEVQAEPLDEWVLGDQGRLVAALRNLVLNALQHSDAGATVSARLMVDQEPEEEGRIRCCHFVVEDEGPGFALHDLDQVTTPFFSRRKGGIGLGLAIAQRVAQQFEGSLALENRSSGGARAVITLPLGWVQHGIVGSGLDDASSLR